MNQNVSIIQKQIKAFNKALSRADKAGSISNEAYAQITDLIDWDRMTRGGYAKAGTKYLESLTPEELLAFSSDIKVAKSVIELEKLSSLYDLTYTKDAESILWSMYQKLEDLGMPFDSADYKTIVDRQLSNESTQSMKQLLASLYKYANDPEYGLSDYLADYEAKEGIKL